MDATTPLDGMAGKEGAKLPEYVDASSEAIDDALANWPVARNVEDTGARVHVGYVGGTSYYLSVMCKQEFQKDDAILKVLMSSVTDFDMIAEWDSASENAQLLGRLKNETQNGLLAFRI